ncbi:MAG: hypothetical protein V2I67_09315 [Thermoanaerobaculales bacterium]|jgi:hypothetical protein|nr:hypothetical protein [Thermoanaerobaculales bacterium]
MKQSMLIALPVLVLAACGGAPIDEPAAEGTVVEEAVAEAPAEPQVVELAALVGSTAAYVDQVVTVTGTVDHVCKHGGKRLFIMGEDPEMRFKVTAGEAIGAFERELEGSDITVTGIVEEQIIDEAYIDSLEAEAPAEDAEEAHAEGADAEAEEHHAGEGDQAAHLRQMLADNGSDSMSFYSLDCSSFEIIE